MGLGRFSIGRRGGYGGRTDFTFGSHRQPWRRDGSLTWFAERRLVAATSVSAIARVFRLLVGG
eukprot:11213190-Lingulodinium_polyedra.AAC.1